MKYYPLVFFCIAAFFGCNQNQIDTLEEAKKIELFEQRRDSIKRAYEEIKKNNADNQEIIAQLKEEKKEAIKNLEEQMGIMHMSEKGEKIKKDKKQDKEKKEKNINEKAAEKAEKLKEKLGLDDKQTASATKIYADYERNKEQVKEKYKFDKETEKKMKKELERERDKAIISILNDNQLSLFKIDDKKD